MYICMLHLPRLTLTLTVYCIVQMFSAVYVCMYTVCFCRIFDLFQNKESVKTQIHVDNSEHAEGDSPLHLPASTYQYNEHFPVIISCGTTVAPFEPDCDDEKIVEQAMKEGFTPGNYVSCKLVAVSHLKIYGNAVTVTVQVHGMIISSLYKYCMIMSSLYKYCMVMPSLYKYCMTISSLYKYCACMIISSLYKSTV